MTRTALLSDIHGNAVALRAVLAELDAEGIDRAVCLGDVCQGGPAPDVCVDLLAERDWPVVLGNADAFVLDPGDGEGPAEGLTERLLAVRGWTYERLGPSRREIVDGYSPTVQLDLAVGRTLLGCHATPASYDPVVFPSAPEDEFRSAFGGTGAYVVACGHIHLPYVRRVGATLVVNPGSIGLGYDHEQDETSPLFDPWAAWAVVAADAGGRFSLEFRRTPFDVDAVVETCRLSGMPFADEYARPWLSSPTR